MTRLLRGLLVALALLALTAGPAGADPAGPSAYDSTVTAVEGDSLPAGLVAEVFGGDSYLVLTVPAGTSVMVPGYDVDDPGREGPPESYLRFDADGSVYVNVRSRTNAQNAERYGVQESSFADQVDPDAPPDWQLVSTDGVYAWHDHRIHWMTPQLPQQVSAAGSAAQPVFDWRIPITVDGVDAAIVGSLVYTPPSLELAPVLMAALGFAALGAVGWRSARRLALAVLVMGLVGLGWAIVRALEAPTGADLEVVQLVLPAAAVVASGIGVAVARRGAPSDADARDEVDRGVVLAGLAGLALLALGLVNAGAFTQPFLPTGQPVLFRLVAGLAVGAGLGAMLLALRDLLAGQVALGGDLSDLADLDADDHLAG